MYFLGIDTSAPTGSVGLIRDREPIGEVTLNVTTTHSERLLESVKFLVSACSLKLEDIDVYAWAKGPGSFTGLRIGLATVKGLAFSMGRKTVGVSSLEVLAHNLSSSKYRLCPMIDARKKEVYTALFEFDEKKGMKRIMDDEACRAEDFLKNIRKKTLFFGTGALLYRDTIRKIMKSLAVFPSEKASLPSGINVALLGHDLATKKKFDDLESVTPNYLRKSEAELHFKK